MTDMPERITLHRTLLGDLKPYTDGIAGDFNGAEYIRIDKYEELKSALEELVRLKDLKGADFPAENDLADYRVEKPLAWDHAKRVLHNANK